MSPLKLNEARGLMPSQMVWVELANSLEGGVSLVYATVTSVNESSIRFNKLSSDFSWDTYNHSGIGFRLWIAEPSAEERNEYSWM